jgi:hypothetical protein
MPRSVPLLPNDPQISPGAILFAELQPATIEDLVEFDGPIVKLGNYILDSSDLDA